MAISGHLPTSSVILNRTLSELALFVLSGLQTEGYTLLDLGIQTRSV
jgi:hypothetical protein